MPKLCRCGHDEESSDPHPCHYNGYTCRKPAKARMYVPTMLFSLAGVQTKVSAIRTWACDEHWAVFMAALKDKCAQEIELAKRLLASHSQAAADK